MSANEFNGKIALVTGATSGIGRATALALARRGASLALAGRNAQNGKAIVEACNQFTPSSVFLQVDVTRPEDIERMVENVLSQFGRLDIAFNNAGYQEPRALLGEQPEEVFDRVFATNVRAIFQAMKAEIAVMARQGSGVIVNNASVSGLRNPNPGLSLYSASKAAVISLTRSAAMEYAPRRIRINAISPGRITTPMMLNSQIADMDAVAAGLPSRRMGQAEEVAEAVVWLASEAASFVVGHNLCVDGGFLAQ
jgi:NAD(P)-dependent dehydrogenase (short-subunit alcohol dehydrogenase family)